MNSNRDKCVKTSNEPPLVTVLLKTENGSSYIDVSVDEATIAPTLVWPCVTLTKPVHRYQFSHHQPYTSPSPTSSFLIPSFHTHRVIFSLYPTFLLHFAIEPFLLSSCHFLPYIHAPSNSLLFWFPPFNTLLSPFLSLFQHQTQHHLTYIPFIPIISCLHGSLCAWAF